MLSFKKILFGTSILFAVTGCTAVSDNTSSFNLSITDGPVDDASAVYVQFSSIMLKSAKNDDVLIEFDPPKRINLLDLQGDSSASLISDYALAAGDYQFIQLAVETGNNTSIITISGADHDLDIPSGSESGLKLVNGFTAPANGSVDFTIDFDLRKSITESNGSYHLRPALRLIDNVTVGHIKGDVTSALTANSCGADGNAVYIYEGNDVTPGDINTTTGDDVVTTALVKYDDSTSSYSYAAGYLTAGNYTIALTCEADSDNVDQKDNISFVSTANVVVEDKKTTTQDL